MGKLSDRNNNITQVPSPQSPDKAGMQQQWLGTTANIPENWLEANGASLDRSTYSQLFTAIGTKYGDGDTVGVTFALPQGRYLTNEINLNLINITDSFLKDYAIGQIYNDVFGNWYLEFNLRVSGGLVTSDFMELEIDGLDFFFAGGVTEQAISVASANTQPITQMIAYNDGPNTNRIQMGGEGSHNIFTAAGRVKLNSKPTDLLVSVDSNYTTFEETYQYIPIVKAFDDSGSVAISQI